MAIELKDIIGRFRKIKQGIPARKKANSIFFGEHQKSVFKGVGYEIAGVTEWRPGQPMKDIAPKLSLISYPKFRKIEKVEPHRIRTFVALDISSSMFFSVEPKSNKIQLALDLVGDIAFTSVDYQDPVGLMCFSDKIEKYLRPKLGSAHVYHMATTMCREIDKIGREILEGNQRKADLNVLLRFLYRVPQSRCSVVVISDFVDLINLKSEEDPDWELDWDLLKRTAVKHNVFFLFLDDPLEFKATDKFGYTLETNIETSETVSISNKKRKRIRQDVELRRGEMIELLRRANVHSEVFTYGNHFKKLIQFMSVTRAGFNKHRTA